MKYAGTTLLPLANFRGQIRVQQQQQQQAITIGFEKFEKENPSE